jgi:xylose dehydrogenase (NAD/NADP)
MVEISPAMGFFREPSKQMDESYHRDWDVTASTGTVRVALVGLGNFSLNRTLPAIQSCDHVEPTVLVSGSIEKAKQITNEQDLDVATAITYEMYEEGVETSSYDAVYIATPDCYSRTIRQERGHVGEGCTV